jgi:hypothetical protein
VALGLDEAERLAFLVILGGFEGASFDWAAMRWRAA